MSVRTILSYTYFKRHTYVAWKSTTTGVVFSSTCFWKSEESWMLIHSKLAAVVLKRLESMHCTETTLWWDLTAWINLLAWGCQPWLATSASRGNARATNLPDMTYGGWGNREHRKKINTSAKKELYGTVPDFHALHRDCPFLTDNPCVQRESGLTHEGYIIHTYML